MKELHHCEHVDLEAICCDVQHFIVDNKKKSLPSSHFIQLQENTKVKFSKLNKITCIE